METSVYVIGDVHGNFPYLNSFINKKNPSIILQCGDIGCWPGFHNTTTIQLNSSFISEFISQKPKKWDQYGIKNPNTIIYFCDGNHEDHFSLKALRDKSVDVAAIPVMSNVFYVPRCKIIKLQDGRNVLFIGGAESTDKQYRTIGVDWFPDEVITQSDIRQLPDEEIDIVISHTCPEEVYTSVSIFPNLKGTDPSSKALSHILSHYQPKEWYFAHFHTSKSGVIGKTTWTCLNQENDQGWWKNISLT